jgi:hypothetical protein
MDMLSLLGGPPSDEERVEYVYANNVLISVNPIEVKFRFVLMTGGGTKIVAKVIMHPLFLRAVQEYADDLIQEYEEKYGPYPEHPKDNKALIENFFGKPIEEGEDDSGDV